MNGCSFENRYVQSCKAYYCVEWVLLKHTMLWMGFDRKLVELVMLCISIVNYKVINNGYEIGSIIPHQGL